MIPISTLTPAADVGRAVRYTPTGERGTITSWSDAFIYVRYGSNPQGNATNPEDLEWERAPLSKQPPHPQPPLGS
jgi:hypothetical protein